METDGKTEDQKVDVVGTTPSTSSIRLGARRIAIDPGNWVLKASPISGALPSERSAVGGTGRPGGGARPNTKRRWMPIRKALWRAIASVKCYLHSATTRPVSTPIAMHFAVTATPRWTEVWSHIALGNIFDITGQRDRAVNEYGSLCRQTTTPRRGKRGRLYLQKPYTRPEGE